MIGPRLTDDDKSDAKDQLSEEEYELLLAADDPLTELSWNHRQWLLQIIVGLCQQIDGMEQSALERGEYL